MPTRVRELERRWAVLGLVLLVWATGWLTLAVSSAGDSQVVTWWPPVGIAATLVTVTPRRWWWWTLPAVLAANAAANLLDGRPPVMAVVLSSLVVAEAVVFAFVMRLRPGGLAVLATQADFLRLFGAAALASAVGAATGAALLPVAGADESTRYYLLTILPSHGASILVIAPVLMSLRRPLLPVRLWELVLQTAAVTVTSLGVFGLSDTLALTFLPIPFLVWGAFRFGLRVVAVEVVVVAVVASACTTRGLGPFAMGDVAPGDRLGATSLVQTFLICLALVCVPLAVNVEQSVRLTERLRASSDLFRRNFSESLVAMLVLRLEHGRLRVYDANQQTTTLLGLDRDEVVGRPLAELLDTETPLDVIAAEVTTAEGTGWRGEGRMQHRPERQVLLSVTRLSGSDDEPMFNAQLLDLTSEREARADLDAERRLTDITLATTACLIVVSDLEGTLLRVNPALGRLLGVETDALVARRVWDVLVLPEHREVTQRMFSGSGHPDIPTSVEGVLLDADHRERRIAWTSAIAPDHEGNPSYVVMTGLDITAELDAAGLTQHLLAAALDTALVGTDLTGRITFFSPGAERLLAARALERVSTPLVDLLEAGELSTWAHDRGSSPTFETLLAHLLDGAAQDWTWRRGDGSHVLVAMSLTRVTDHGGSLIGYLCVGRDVSESRETQEMLATALEKERTVVERLRHLDVAKDEFVSTVSHELRTPVASIVGYTELLQDGDFGDVPPEQVPVVDAINRNAARLVTLVDNLLALNDLREETPGWERSRIDLVDLVHSLEHSATASEASHRLQLCFNTPGEPVLVEGDWAQLERALGNVLGNALKFTEPRGEVTCTLEVAEDTAVVTVRDTGLGIPREEQGSLFTRFWRSSTAQARHIQGTGLGLSIAHAIITSHGGTVTLESEHLQGTTVTVRLPVRPG
ncbi:sensor histidine kinase [Nocardioides solisilvae]|uniref:sensor histidine kinase n=1 Tax=Nocardioides solisilvae TaxID=1542435 RepID=UPI000D7493FD|nr:sensor histidine kinase [Nocardioides solisilvae]